MSRILLILASSSFLRRTLMDATSLAYEVDSPDIDESVYSHLSVRVRVLETAREKCRVAALRHPQSIIISADTLTYDEANNITEDKTTGANPRDILGKDLAVFTATVIKLPDSDDLFEHISKTIVSYTDTDKNNLERLLSLDRNKSRRSGSLGIYTDSPGFGLIDKFNGSYSGALGLELPFLYRVLSKAGYFKLGADERT